MDKIKFSTIEEAIEDFKQGKFVIVVDDEDRENEGDFITPAEMITPEKVNLSISICSNAASSASTATQPLRSA